MKQVYKRFQTQMGTESDIQITKILSYNNMKKIIFLFLFVSSSIYSQVIISPYVVYMDQKDRFGTYIVQNKSLEEYEISISFVFGYPVTDSLGNGTMKYVENPADSLPSIAKWIRAFPRSFILVPEQKQIVRMTVRPPAYIEPGTYWTRMVTSSTPKAPPVDTLKEGISAKVRFVLNQVTTVIYRVNDATTGLDMEDIVVNSDSNNLQVFVGLNRDGNSAFFGNMTTRLFNSIGDTVQVKEDFVQVYFDINKRVDIPLEGLIEGSYTAEVEIKFNEKEDIPESRLIPMEYVYRKEINFNYPLQ
ncbi:MAG: hypothetical protein PF445_07260 [Melioribacteraceae bacterium]|jgi:hypothetical protein|nr:hypothetical protein [Melioribacteraceae bacterium]